MPSEAVPEAVSTEAAAAPAGRGESRVARNALVYLATQALSWGLTLAWLAVIPRAFGEKILDEVTLAITAVGNVSGLLLLGTETYLTKEFGRDEAAARRLLQGAVGLRLALLGVLLPGSLAALWLLNGSRLVWEIGVLQIVVSAANMFLLLFRGALSGREQARRVASCDLLATLGMVACLPFLWVGPRVLVLGALLSVVATVAFQVRWLRGDTPLAPCFDFAVWRDLLRGGIPLFANTLIAQVYASVPIYALHGMAAGQGYVAVWGQASKLLGTFLFLPTALGSALLPAMARMSEADPAEMRRIQRRVFTAMIVMALPFTVLAQYLADPFCRLLYGPDQFRALPGVLRVCGLVIVPLYLTTTMYQFVVAQDKAKTWSLVLVGTVTASSAASLLLTPWTLRLFGNAALGPAWAVFLGELLGVLFALRLTRLNPFSRDETARLLRALLAAGGMALAMWPVRNLFLLVPASVGLFTFAFLAWLLNVPTGEEKARLTALLRDKLPRPKKT